MRLGWGSGRERLREGRRKPEVVDCCAGPSQRETLLPQRRREPVEGRPDETRSRSGDPSRRSRIKLQHLFPPRLWAGAIPGTEEGHWIMLSCRADDVPGTAYRHAPITSSRSLAPAPTGVLAWRCSTSASAAMDRPGLPTPAPAREAVRAAHRDPGAPYGERGAQRKRGAADLPSARGNSSRQAAIHLDGGQVDLVNVPPIPPRQLPEAIAERVEVSRDGRALGMATRAFLRRPPRRRRGSSASAHRGGIGRQGSSAPPEASNWLSISDSSPIVRRAC